MRLAEDRRATVLLCSVVALPFLLSGLHAAVTGWVPTWDTAFIQLRVLDVGTRRTSLLGMPSTVSEMVGGEIHHPGPMQFWLLALPYVLLRHLRAGLTIAQSLIDAGVVLVALFAARAVGGMKAAWAAAGAVLVVALALGDETLHDPWNPQFGLVCLLAATGCVLALTRATVPWVMAAVAFLASCVAQAHLVGLLQAVTLVALAVAVVVRRDGWRGSRRSLVWGLAGGFAAWLGPIVDQLIHSPGNLRALLGDAGDTGASFGLVAAFDRFARVLVPPGLLHDGVQGIAVGAERQVLRLVAVAMLVVVVVGWRWRQRRGDPTGLALVTGVSVVSAVIAQSITPIAFASLFGRHVWAFMFPAVLLVWASIGLLVADLARGRQQWPLPTVRGWSARPMARPVLLCTGVAAVIVMVFASPVDEQRDGVWFATVTEVGDAIPIDELDAEVVFRSDGIPLESELVAGLAAELQRRGVFVRFDGPIAPGLLHPRHLGAAPTASLLVTAGDAAAPEEGTLLITVPSRAEWIESPVRVYLLPAPTT